MSGNTGLLPNDATLMREAVARTGLSDWGDDPSFRDGLPILIDAVTSMPYSEELHRQVRTRIEFILDTRLRLVDDARRHPEIVAQTIERPLVIVGLPRTGTTIMYDLLTRDPAARAPREFELHMPWPASEVDTFATDPRIAVVQGLYQKYIDAAPHLESIQRLDCTQPGECNHGMVFHFAGSNFWADYGVPKHAQWVMETIPDGLYRTHKRLLQQFQWHGPKGRWVLKSPHHLFDLPGLIEAYPDAGLVWTHRDPVSTFSSLASMVAAMQSAVGGGQDKKAIGRSVMELWSAAVARATRLRAEHPELEARIIDMAHRDVVADPAGAVRRVYERFGLPFTPELDERIASFLRENPSASRLGKHKHSPEEFGIDRAEVHERLAGYYARFGHLLEAA